MYYSNSIRYSQVEDMNHMLCDYNLLGMFDENVFGAKLSVGLQLNSLPLNDTTTTYTMKFYGLGLERMRFAFAGQEYSK